MIVTFFFRRRGTTRFKIKDLVSGAEDRTHLEIIIREVEDQLVTNQVRFLLKFSFLKNYENLYRSC